MELKWKENFEIRFRIDDGSAVISANRDGLLSLADQLTMLAGEEPGSHIHYDAYNSLEDGSDGEIDGIESVHPKLVAPIRTK